MSSTLLARSIAIMAIPAAASLAGKEGYFYKRDSSNLAVLCSAVTDIPEGIILAVRADGMEISGYVSPQQGTVRVKLGGNVTDLRKLLTLKNDSSAVADAGSSARVQVAKPLETGTSGEVIECVLINPVAIAS